MNEADERYGVEYMRWERDEKGNGSCMLLETVWCN